MQLSKQAAVSSLCCWFVREKIKDGSIFSDSAESIPVYFNPTKKDNPDANALYKGF